MSAGARSPKDWADDRVVPVTVDLGDAASIDASVKQTGDTTFLVNNAAIFPRSELLTGPEDELLAVLQTNLIGPICLTRALAPSLAAAGGALVNVYNALEADEYELLTDPTAAKVHGALAAPVTALYPALA